MTESKMSDEDAKIFDEIVEDAMNQRYGIVVPPQRPRTLRCVLGFELPPGEEEGYRIARAFPTALFKPKGLLVFGAGPYTMIHDIIVGHVSMFLGSGPAPGAFYSLPESLARFFLEFQIDHEDPDKEPKEPVLPPWMQLDYPVTEIGEQIRIRYSGPLTGAAMWGLKA